jgi:hypothetical protein
MAWFAENLRENYAVPKGVLGHIEQPKKKEVSEAVAILVSEEFGTQ